MRAIVQRVVASTAEVRIIELAAADGGDLPAYAPGAHVDVTLPDGLVRQYSLCCAQPSPRRYRIAVKRERQSRGGSAWLHDVAAAGTALDIGTPRSAFGIAPEAAAHLLCAGGIGITPLLSMAYALAARAAPFHLACFARAPELVPFADELTRGPLVASASTHCGLDAAGTLARIDALLRDARPGTHVYACGPAPFMAAVAERAQLHGAAGMHTESFGPAAPTDGDRPFVLRLAASGREIAVPADRSALACLQEAGIDIASSCEVGVCGTCMTTVREGAPEHRDSYLTTAERAANTCFLPCVSRSRTATLTIDL